MECYSGQNCRFSHDKLDEELKKMLLKTFGKLRSVPPEYENENRDIKNSFEKDSKPITENNFISKTDKNKIPSLLEMQIPIPHELKSIEKNSDDDLEEANNNNNNSSTQMPSTSGDDYVIDDTFEINKNEKLPNSRSMHKVQKYHDTNKDKKRQRQKKEMRKKLREERHEEKRMEKSKQRKENLSISTNDHPLLDDFSDDDEFNDLVIDEEKFQNDGKDQQLPKKQKELLKRIQVRQKLYNETNMSEDPYQEEQYSSDVSNHSVFNPMNNVLSSLQNNKKEQSSKPSSSKVEKVYLGQITINDDMAKLLNIIRAIGTGRSTNADESSPFRLQPLEKPYDFEETVQEKKSIIEESPYYYLRTICGTSNVVELGRSDVDLRQLPFQFPVAAATEIDASLVSHPPMKYRLYLAQVSVTDYSKIPPTMGIDDPRLRHSIIAARHPWLVQNVSAIGNAAVVRPIAPQKSVPRDPRKPQQDVNTCASGIRFSHLPTPNPHAQQQQHQHSMDSDMRHVPPPIMYSQMNLQMNPQMNPQMMAVPNDPRRIPMVPGDPRQKQRFDVDQRINNINYY